MTRFQAVVFSIALAGCNGGGSAGSGSPPSAAGSVTNQSQKNVTNPSVPMPSMVDDSQLSTLPIYIAKANLSVNKVEMLAIWEGQFLVDSGCLIFRSYSTDYLPVFSTTMAVKVGRDSFNVAGLTRKLGETVSMGGGEVSGLDRYLVEPVPASCTKKFIRF